MGKINWFAKKIWKWSEKNMENLQVFLSIDKNDETEI